MKEPGVAKYLAIGGLILVAIIMILMFFVAIPKDNQSTVQLVLGALVMWVGSTYTYYYGSTNTSRAKDETISTMAKTAGTGGGVAVIAEPPLKTTTTSTTETNVTHGDGK